MNPDKKERETIAFLQNAGVLRRALCDRETFADRQRRSLPFTGVRCGL